MQEYAIPHYYCIKNSQLRQFMPKRSNFNYVPHHRKLQKLLLRILPSVKINQQENDPEYKNSKINSNENKMGYSMLDESLIIMA